MCVWCGMVWRHTRHTWSHTHCKTKQDIYVVADSANLFSGAQMVDGKRNMDIKGGCVQVYVCCASVFVGEGGCVVPASALCLPPDHCAREGWIRGCMCMQGPRIHSKQRPPGLTYPFSSPPSITPVNLATTLPLIDDARPIKQRVVVASFPERQNRMWRYFEQRRYQVCETRVHALAVAVCVMADRRGQRSVLLCFLLLCSCVGLLLHHTCMYVPTDLLQDGRNGGGRRAGQPGEQHACLLTS